MFSKYCKIKCIYDAVKVQVALRVLLSVERQANYAYARGHVEQPRRRDPRGVNSGGVHVEADENALTRTITEQLGIALDSARLYQGTQRRAAREQMIGEVTARIRETLDMETMLQTAAREIEQGLGLYDVTIRLESEEIEV